MALRGRVVAPLADAREPNDGRKKDDAAAAASPYEFAEMMGQDERSAGVKVEHSQFGVQLVREEVPSEDLAGIVHDQTDFEALSCLPDRLEKVVSREICCDHSGLNRGTLLEVSRKCPQPSLTSGDKNHVDSFRRKVFGEGLAKTGGSTRDQSPWTVFFFEASHHATSCFYATNFARFARTNCSVRRSSRNSLELVSTPLVLARGGTYLAARLWSHQIAGKNKHFPPAIRFKAMLTH